MRDMTGVLFRFIFIKIFVGNLDINIGGIFNFS
jgi:hypothetical protein